MRLVFLIVLFLSPAKSSVASEIHLQWAINSAPPFHIIDGPDQGQGICDVLMAAVDRLAPELQASVLVMPQRRISQAMEEKANLCFPCMIYNPEENQQVYFSAVTHIYSPYQIITTPEMALQIEQRYGRPVSLSALLADQDFRFGYPAGRKYKEINSIISRFTPFLARAGEGGAGAILDMIQARRLDYTVDYPAIANYYQQTKQASLVMLDIAEQQQQFVAGAVGCARTDWGQQVVEQLNRIMPQLRQDEAFQQVLKRWYGQDPDTFQRFNAYWLQYLEQDKNVGSSKLP